MAITDTFPPPALDSAKWSSTLQGTVALDVGFPVDGVFFHGVDDDNDSGVIDSENKIIVPGGTGFDAHIYYDGIYVDPEQVVTTFFGWRSLQKDMSGDPLNGVDVMLSVTPAGLYTFRNRVINWGATNDGDIAADPSSGAPGGFRIVRVGSDYQLYRRDGASWLLIDTVTLPQIGQGFIVFGLFAIDASIVFPWVAQT